jgi:predicted transcriptional regulator
MAKYRSKVEIVADILEVSREGAKKTHIIYRGNLSFKLAELYLEVVLRAGLLALDRKNGLYRLTKHGEAFLERFGKYCRFARSLEKQNERVAKELKLLERMCFRKDLPDSNEGRRGKVKGARGNVSARNKVLVEG